MDCLVFACVLLSVLPLLAERPVGVGISGNNCCAASRWGSRITPAREAFGRALLEMLDGPDRALARRVREARVGRHDRLELVVRVVGSGRPGDSMARYPATRWS